MINCYVSSLPESRSEPPAGVCTGWCTAVRAVGEWRQHQSVMHSLYSQQNIFSDIKYKPKKKIVIKTENVDNIVFMIRVEFWIHVIWNWMFRHKIKLFTNIFQNLSKHFKRQPIQLLTVEHWLELCRPGCRCCRPCGPRRTCPRCPWCWQWPSGGGCCGGRRCSSPRPAARPLRSQQKRVKRQK